MIHVSHSAQAHNPEVKLWILHSSLGVEVKHHMCRSQISLSTGHHAEPQNVEFNCNLEYMTATATVEDLLSVLTMLGYTLCTFPDSDDFPELCQVSIHYHSWQPGKKYNIIRQAMATSLPCWQPGIHMVLRCFLYNES